MGIRGSSTPILTFSDEEPLGVLLLHLRSLRSLLWTDILNREPTAQTWRSLGKFVHLHEVEGWTHCIWWTVLSIHALVDAISASGLSVIDQLSMHLLVDFVMS